MRYLHSTQPRRDAHDAKGNELYFRTWIDWEDSSYDVFHPENVKSQVMLYRWASNEQQYVNGVSIGELYDYLFFDYPGVTKKHMGGTILQAVSYNPRLLKGQTLKNGKACMTYVFGDRLDLVYGLEWMMSMWLPVATGAPKEDVLKLLAEVIACGDGDLERQFFGPESAAWVEERLPKLNWPKIWEKQELYHQSKPYGTTGPREGVRPPAPKSRLNQ